MSDGSGLGVPALQYLTFCLQTLLQCILILRISRHEGVRQRSRDVCGYTLPSDVSADDVLRM